MPVISSFPENPNALHISSGHFSLGATITCCIKSAFWSTLTVSLSSKMTMPYRWYAHHPRISPASFWCGVFSRAGDAAKADSEAAWYRTRLVAKLPSRLVAGSHVFGWMKVASQFPHASQSAAKSRSSQPGRLLNGSSSDMLPVIPMA